LSEEPDGREKGSERYVKTFFNFVLNMKRSASEDMSWFGLNKILFLSLSVPERRDRYPA